LSALITVAHAGQAPTILAADERVGHVFVLNSSFAPTISRRAASSSVSMLDARTGHVLNTVSVAPNLQSVVVDEQTKRVFVASEGPLAANGGPIGRGNVSVVDATTGTIAATIPLSGALAVNEPRGCVYLLDNNGVEVLDATTGRVRRHIGGVVGGAIVVDPQTNRAFVSSDGGTITMLDTTKGTVAGTIPARGGARMVAVDTRAARVFYLSGTFRQGDLTALDARTGAERYDVPAGDAYPTVAAVDERLGRVYVESNPPESNSGPVPTSIAIHDAATGQHIRDTPLGLVGFPTTPNGAQSIAVDEAHGQVFVLTVPFTLDHNGVPRHGPARLVTFDAATGTVSSSVGVGKDPQAVVVDARLRRVFVANRGDNTVSVFDADSVLSSGGKATVALCLC